MHVENAHATKSAHAESSIEIELQSYGGGLPPVAENITLKCSPKSSSCFIKLLHPVALGDDEGESNGHSSASIGEFGVSVSFSELQGDLELVRSTLGRENWRLHSRIDPEAVVYTARYSSARGARLESQWRDAPAAEIGLIWKKWRALAMRSPLRALLLDCTSELKGRVLDLSCKLKNSGSQSALVPMFTSDKVRIVSLNTFTILDLQSFEVRASLPSQLKPGESLDLRIKGEAKVEDAKKGPLNVRIDMLSIGRAATGSEFRGVLETVVEESK